MTDESRDARLAIWIALVAALAYLPFNHGHFSASDETGVYQTAQALWHDGDLAVQPGKHIFAGRDGRHYSHFAVGQSVWVLPFMVFGEGVGALLPRSVEESLFAGRGLKGHIDQWETPGILGASLYAPSMTGVLLGIFFLFQRRLKVSQRSAVWATALLGGATYVATHSVFFLRHTTEAAAILGSLFFLHRFRETGRAGDLAWGTALASALVWIRVPAVVGGPALAGYFFFVLWEHRRRGGKADLRLGLAAIGPPLVFALLHLGTNAWRWGSWIASPMLGQSPLLQGDLGKGLSGLLFSSGAGMFVYSPLLCLLPLTLPAFWRTQRALSLAIGALSAGFLLLCGSFYFWHGLWSAPGPRYLFALIPLWMLPLGGWLDGARGRLRWLVVAALALPGAAIQFVLMAVNWRRAVEIAGYQAEIAELGFLYEPLRGPILGCARALLAGEVDVYLWTLFQGASGREPLPMLALGLAIVWAALFALAVRGFRRSRDGNSPRNPGPPPLTLSGPGR